MFAARHVVSRSSASRTVFPKYLSIFQPLIFSLLKRQPRDSIADCYSKAQVLTMPLTDRE